MSRKSNDQYREGRLINGYDYVNQAWVIEGRYQECGHPDEMTCDCYGRKHNGEHTKPGRLDGSEPEDTAVTLCRELLPAFDRHERMKEQAIEVIKEAGPETPLGKGARIALNDLTEKEKAFDFKEIETAADKVRTTNAPDILTGPTFSQYYTQRRKTLRTDLDHMVRIISTPGQDTPENLRHRLTLIARLAELDTARESIGFDGYPAGQDDQDDAEKTRKYFDPLAGEHDPR